MLSFICFFQDDQVKYNQMSASTGEVALDIMDQSFSGELTAPQGSAPFNGSDNSFGSLIKQKGDCTSTVFSRNVSIKLMYETASLYMICD